MGLPLARHRPLTPVLREVDADTGSVGRELVLPSDGSPQDDAELTGATLVGDILWQCTRTAVLEIDVRRFEVVRRTTHPLFYDLHSVVPLSDGGFVVTATGHESVLVMGPDRAVREHHWLRGPLAGFTDAYGVADFRAISTDRFKPHTHHPNRAFYRDQTLMVTVMYERCCRGIAGGPVIDFPEGWPHDGLLRDGLFWFTTVPGVVIGVDAKTFERREVHDLRSAWPGDAPGWCRAVEVDGGSLWVGFSSLRSTRWRELLRQVVTRGRKLPTRVVRVERATSRVAQELDVGQEGSGTLYAIHRWSP